MVLEYNEQALTQQLSAEEQEVLSLQLQQTMHKWIYSNRNRVTPRRIKELVQEQIVLLQQFLLGGESEAVRAFGERLVDEGFGTQTIINMASTLRLGCLELADPVADRTQFVTAVEQYAVALLGGFLSAYEEDLCREQQRTYDSLTRSLNKL